MSSSFPYYAECFIGDDTVPIEHMRIGDKTDNLFWADKVNFLVQKYSGETIRERIYVPFHEYKWKDARVPYE